MLKRALFIVLSSLLVVSPVFAQAVNPTVSVSPASQNLSLNQQVVVAINIANGQNVGGYQFGLNYNPAVLQVVGITDNGWVASSGRTTVPVGPQIDNTAGTASFGVFSFGAQSGVTGSNTLAQVTVKAIGVGQSALTLHDVSIVDTNANTATVILSSGSITVPAAPTPTPSPTPTLIPTSTPTPTPISLAHLVLTNVPVSAHVNDNFDAGVNLDTTTPITGADVIVTFDTGKLQATGVTDNHLLPNTPKIEIHNDTGLVKVSQVANPGQPWSGTGSMFTINFQTTAVGIANIGFSYTPGLLTDSNVIANASGADILQAPSSAAVTISALPTPTPTPTPSPTATPTPTSIPTPTPTPAPIVGDINHDGVVNNIDLSLMYDDWFSAAVRSDLNHDGVVNTGDYWLLAQNFFQGGN